MAFLVIVVVLYYATRASHYHQPAAANAATMTYSCARCGRRGPREAMSPLTQTNATIWYCKSCRSG